MAKPFAPIDEETETQSPDEELHELNSVVVEPEPAEPDDDDDDEGTSEPEQRPSRRERRRQRASGYNELKETNERLARELQETRLAQQRMQGMLEANLYRPQQQQGPHPLEQAVDEVLREQDEFYQSYSANLPKMTEVQREQAQARARELEKKKMAAVVRLENARMGVSQGPQPQQIRQMAFQEQLNMRYSDIAADTKASEIGGHIARRMFAEGKPQTWETLDEAAEETRRVMGWQSKTRAPKPTPRDQQRFTGTPKGPSGGGGTKEAGPIRISKKQAQMAENANPHLPAPKAHQKWWNEVGKKHA